MDPHRVEPSKCRRCGTLILWAQRASGKLVSVGATGDERGDIVLFARRGRVLRAETFDAAIHGPRKRYSEHRRLCAGREDARRNFLD